jgi:hypothetical protein
VNPVQLDRQCLMHGCSVGSARAILKQAQEIENKMKALTVRTEFVSAALWCDIGEHSFSAKDRKKTNYKIETTDEETGQPVEDIMTACGPCAARRKAMFQPAPALPAGVDTEEYTHFLEWKNGIGSTATPGQDVPVAGQVL